MTIEEFYRDKKESASEVCSSDTDKDLSQAGGIPANMEYITIPTVLYTQLVRQSTLNEAVINVLMSKKVIYKEETLMAILDLPYEEGGEA